MALQGLQNYTFPLTLLGEVTINGDLNAKDIYVSGLVNGAGINTDILGTDNTWTGTNDFQDDAFYTGPNPPSSFFDMMTKLDIDNAAAAYNPLPTTNSWNVAPTFTNANPPVVPVINPVLIQTGPASGNILVGYTDMENIVTTNVNVNQNLTTKSNTFTGINTFSGTISADTTIVPSLLDPTLPQQAASKGYIDGKVELAGKSVIYQILTPGTYNFTDAALTGGSLANVGKIDYWLFSGSCGGASGAVVSGTLGNGNGVKGNIQLVVGTTADPAVVYTAQDTTVPSSTYLSVSNQLVAVADGACNLNGVLTAGVVGSTSMITQQGASANGQLAANNLLDYSNLLGTTTSAGGCLFVAYYI